MSFRFNNLRCRYHRYHLLPTIRAHISMGVTEASKKQVVTVVTW